ncbi:MAG: hybrid sensor histidine kinase/response regulator [Magnetococcales bacterium]|nr:hybrid sensor histidine kinase/response regulator [Magnetococcales bacterium]
MTNPDQRYKILIVDDTPENLKILMEALRNDYIIIAARDGESALRLAMKAPLPDLILLDIMMPGMSGFEVCQHLKDDPDTCDIPILFLTALTDVENETHGLEVGAIDYIHKPITVPVVQARVRNHIELAQARKTLEIQNQELKEAALLREEVERISRHDLKGPLSAVIGLPQLLACEENLTEEQQEWVAQIEHAGYRMLDMINHSLDLYRMETGQYPYQPSMIEMDKVIQHVVSELGSLASSLSATVQLIDNRDQQRAVPGEELLCYTLFANLIKNAIEASENSAVTIQLDDQDSWLSIRIHNNQMVPIEIQKRFFEKYATSGKNRGTGLGTYSAQLITETQAGKLFMETSKKEGTIVTILLPNQFINHPFEKA